MLGYDDSRGILQDGLTMREYTIEENGSGFIVTCETFDLWVSSRAVAEYIVAQSPKTEVEAVKACVQFYNKKGK